ncbi:UNVERIFIED_CONTAM: hypothetical protein PYX00_005010 [Menopon gallinae]|uniref:TBC1 domain family member 30 n=1 Tax=Menopon gallinae TaxID=328185 RepID=A0AAW2I692_9NEOP
MSLFNSLRKLTSGSRNEGDDMKMKFSLAPGTETGFSQWLDAMKMVAQLPGGVPSEFRTKLWLQLSERHLNEQNIDWEKAEAVIFNEWTNPDDEELGVQIVKDLHRTGCSLFCGAQEQNQALLKRVLLAYARWNKNVGYCQGFNMLAALILQVMDRDEKNAVKVMIYLIEGVLPESYFANNLRGLSVDMAVFRDLLRLRLPKLSKHLEALQNDTNSSTSYEPPLTNVFTMQWFLTLFSNCLPQQTVLRVWDLVFLHGNEVLLRTALAIWGILQDRIISVESADEFYSIMGVVTREMLEFGLMDANNLIKMIVMVDPFPNELQELREKYLYNISPWAQSVQSAARKGIRLFYSDPEDQDDTEDEDKIALATAYGVFRRRESGSKEIQPMGPTLDISILKQQYAKLRQRQRQAHIIISAACSSNIPTNLAAVPTVSVNHLLMGKSALVNKGRRIGPPEGSIPPPKNRTSRAIDHKQVPKKEKIVISGETLEWKDAEKRRCSIKGGKRISNKVRNNINNNAGNKTMESCNGVKKDRQLSRTRSVSQEDGDTDENQCGGRRGSNSSESSTSTELCDDDANRLSEIDPEEESASEQPVQRNGCSDPEDRYERAKECAEALVREIEEELQKNERLRLLKNLGNNNTKDAKTSHSTSSHDNMIIDSSATVSGRDTEFLKSEPEVPRNVIDNAENRIFDRSKEEAATFKPPKDRDRRKSDLALSVIKENLEMLSKFTQKAVVIEEPSEKKEVMEIEEEELRRAVIKGGGTEKVAIKEQTAAREDAEEPIAKGEGEIETAAEEQISAIEFAKEEKNGIEERTEGLENIKRPAVEKHEDIRESRKDVEERVPGRDDRISRKEEEIMEPTVSREGVREATARRDEKPPERREKVERKEQVIVNGKSDLFGDHFRQAGKGEDPACTEHSPAPKPVSKVNKEVNTDITIATDVATSPVTTLETIQKKQQSKVDDFLIALHKSPERFKPEKISFREDADSLGQFAREDLAEKWKKESERIESKIEMSKSDWDLKMKKIAELENTTREKLNELKSKSIVHRHRSLDRFESREKRKSPIPKIEVPEEGEKRKKISALSFDEITSRTEKLLGTNLALDSRKWRKSFDEDESGSRSYEFYSSPTSPEYRPRKYPEYSSPKKYDTSPKRKQASAAEEDWLTITEEDGRPRTIEMPSAGRRGDSALLRSPTAFNPFPTRSHSRPKELGVRLGMYPPSPEGPYSSNKS